MHKVYALLQLSGRDRVLLLQALCLTTIMRPGLRLLGLKRMQTVLARIPVIRKPAQTESPLLEARRVAYWVDVATRHSLYAPNCLERSLTLWMLLLRRGIDSALCIGARKDSTELAAHAWIEVQGEVLNDRSDIRQQYALLTDRIPLRVPKNLQ